VILYEPRAADASSDVISKDIARTGKRRARRKSGGFAASGTVRVIQLNSEEEERERRKAAGQHSFPPRLALGRRVAKH